MSRHFFLLLIAVAIPVTLPAEETERFTIIHDLEKRQTKVTIPAQEGRIHWADVIVGVSRARGFDDSVLAGVASDGDFELGGVGSLITLKILNVGLAPNIQFGIERPEEEEPRLVITLDDQAMLASQRRFKSLFRSNPKVPSRLIADEGWELNPVEKNLVVLVHGFNSYAKSVEHLLSGARGEKLPCATFEYPNDQEVEASALALSAELKRIAREHPGRKITLLTHSMGGVVSRAVVENPDLDPGNVTKLVMIAPPSQGSALAYFGFAVDVWTYISDPEARRENQERFGILEDGLAEASVDMRPDSEFLRQLNARERNPRVRYSIFLGTRGPLTDQDLADMREQLKETARHKTWVKFLGLRVDSWLADLEEVLDGKGDSAVAVKRGKLDGVSDTVILHFDHLEMLDRENKSEDVLKLHAEVLKRLIE